MTAPLISDATLAKIVRLLCASQIDDDCVGEIVRAVARERLADALDWVNGHHKIGNATTELIAALEEANEEAARTHDERETWDADGSTPLRPGEVEAANPEIFQRGTVILPSGERIDLGDRDAIKAALVRLFGTGS